MNNGTKKLIKLNCYFFRIFSAVLILLSTRTLATECGILQLQKHRSLGASITHNTCPVITELSLKSVVELQAGTRVWLELARQSPDTESFQIVCLNKSSVVQKLKVAHADFPWLVSLSVSDCSTWLDNRLVCKNSTDQHEILLCAITPKYAPLAMSTVQPKTSVTVRGFNGHLQTQAPDEQRSWAGFVAPGINLCRKLLNTNQAITLSWTIEAAGKVSNASIVESGIDKQFSTCALEALGYIDFPAVPHEIRLTVSF